MKKLCEFFTFFVKWSCMLLIRAPRPLFDESASVSSRQAVKRRPCEKGPRARTTACRLMLVFGGKLI